MYRKALVFVLFLIVLVSSVFAESFIIRDYDFDISGKTQKWVVRNLIIPSGEEKFSSRDELVSALEGKKQALLNKRLFKSVDYTYTEEATGDVVYVDVLYTIVDARSILILPYPKYDTNTGARLGLRVYNSNTLGTFASLTGVIHGTFQPWDFSTTKYYAEFKLTELKLGSTTVSASFSGDATQTDGVSNYDASFSVSNILVAGKFPMAVNLAFKNVTDGEKTYDASWSLSGLSLLGISFTPSVSAKIYETSKASSYITPALSISGIKLWNLNISFSDSVKYTNSEKFKFAQASHYTTLSFSEGKLSQFSLSNGLIYTPQSSLAVNNTLTYRLTGSTTLYLYENLSYTGEDYFLSSLDSGVGISQTMSIGSHTTFTPTVQQWLKTTFSSDGSDPVFSRRFVISGSAGVNLINWKGSFREGVSYSFSISESWNQDYGTLTATGSNVDRVEFTGHKIIFGWLNPSVRVIANYTNDVSGKGAINGGSGGVLGEYLRGIRNQTIYDDGRNNNLFTTVVNLNLLSKFPLPSIMSKWMSAYINGFIDYAFTKHGKTSEEADKIRHYVGFGVEGIGVLHDYPSYPIRLSLGFDARKLLQYVKGETDSRGFFEIYFGIDFFM